MTQFYEVLDECDNITATVRGCRTKYHAVATYEQKSKGRHSSIQKEKISGILYTLTSTAFDKIQLNVMLQYL